MPFRHIPGAVRCELKKGDIIIDEDELVTHVYYLTSGTVKRMAVDEDGTKNVLEIKTAVGSVSSIIGIYILYTSSRCSQLVFQAKTDCVCYKIECEKYLKWVHDQPDILEETIKFLMLEFEILSYAFKGSSKKTTAKQVCKYLLDNVETDGQRYYIPKKYTTHDIACILGIHKMTLSKILRALREEMVIESNNREMVVLDYPKLQKYANEESLQYKKNRKQL